MRSMLLLSVLLPLVALAQQPDSPRHVDIAAPVELVLKVGESKQLDCPGMVRVVVGDPAIVDIKVVGTGLLVVRGAGIGTTTLLWWVGTTRTEVLVRVRK